MKRTSLDLTEEVKTESVATCLTDSTNINQSQTAGENNMENINQNYEYNQDPGYEKLTYDWYVKLMKRAGGNPVAFEYFMLQSQTAGENQNYEPDPKIPDWLLFSMLSNGKKPMSFDEFRTENANLISLLYWLHLCETDGNEGAPITFLTYEIKAFLTYVTQELPAFDSNKREESDLIEEDEECFA